MKNSIYNHIDLEQRIMQLNIEKAEQEELIKHNAMEIYNSFDPVNIIKKNILRITGNLEIQEGILTVLLTRGISLLLKKISGGKKDTEKKFSSFIKEKVSNYFSGHNGALSSINNIMRILFVNSG